MFDTTAEKKFLLKELVKKDLTSKYKDSVLGILWSFLNPLLIMLVFTAIFSMLFGRAIENYPVYFLTGRIIYDFFNTSTKGAMRSMKRNANLLKKIYVPKYMFAVSTICYETINFIISFIILFLVMLLTNATFHWTLIFTIVPIALLICLIYGVGLILAVCNTYFSDVEHLYGVFTLILMYASALFYPMDIVPPHIQRIFTLNPVYSAISCFRECCYGVLPNTGTLLYLAAFSFTTLGIGIILFKIYEKKLVLEL